MCIIIEMRYNHFLNLGNGGHGSREKQKISSNIIFYAMLSFIIVFSPSQLLESKISEMEIADQENKRIYKVIF